MNRKATSTKGFTLVELLVVIAIIALLIGLLLPALATAQRNARTMRDATQLRGIHQTMLTYANENQERMPRPGLISRTTTFVGTPGQLQEQVIPTQGREHYAKNHTRHLYSAMVMMQYFNTDILISPAEANQWIEQYTDYDYNQYDPSSGLFWDGDDSNPPSPDANTAADGADNPNTLDQQSTFLVQWSGEQLTYSNTSYAHLALCGFRVRTRWRARNDASTPNLSSRGPYFGQLTTDASRNDPTFLMHGPRGQWEGNVAFNDNHVTSISTVYPANVTYTRRDIGGTIGQVASSDNIFDAEFDDVDPDNNMASGDAFLGIFAQQPQTTEHETAPVWDYVQDGTPQ